MTPREYGEALVLSWPASAIINILLPVHRHPMNHAQSRTDPSPEVMYEAWKAFPGITYPRDGSEGQAGVVWIPSSKDPVTETRSYARTAHYDPVQSRTNYDILTGHKVAKINFRQTSMETIATNVRIVARADNSSIIVVKAKKEIILAAGAIHTPQILQLSGIGPRQVLKAANVSLVLDLPGVGSNFQDHSWFAVGYNCKPII